MILILISLINILTSILKLINNQNGLVQPGISFHYSLNESNKNKPISKLNNFRVYFKPVNAGNENKLTSNLINGEILSFDQFEFLKKVTYLISLNYLLF